VARLVSCSCLVLEEAKVAIAFLVGNRVRIRAGWSVSLQR
jgi:hypothetical protein